MFPDVVLILITLASAIIGTLSTPPSWVKAVIISLAIFASVASITKSYIDDQDKEIEKHAFANSLIASEPEIYRLLKGVVDPILSDDTCNQPTPVRITLGAGSFCYKVPDGDKSAPPDAPFTKVAIFTNDDLLIMFQNDLDEPRFRVFRHLLVYLGQTIGVSESFLSKYKDGYLNSRYVKDILTRTYSKNDREEPTSILQRIEILGSATFRTIAQINPYDASYDIRGGVKINYNVRGKYGDLAVGTDTIEQLSGEKEMKIFTDIGNQLRLEIVNQAKSWNPEAQ